MFKSDLHPKIARARFMIDAVPRLLPYPFPSRGRAMKKFKFPEK